MAVIQDMQRPRDAFDLSRKPSVSPWLRNDWEKVKCDVMLKALLAKFTQHEDLKRLLLSTGNRHLVEHTSNDSFWGDGGNGSGQNNLGRLLMEVRQALGQQRRGVSDDGDETEARGGSSDPELIDLNSQDVGQGGKDNEKGVKDKFQYCAHVQLGVGDHLTKQASAKNGEVEDIEEQMEWYSENQTETRVSEEQLTCGSMPTCRASEGKVPCSEEAPNICEEK